MAGKGDSLRSILFALGANFAIFVAKSVAAVMTGSSAMLAEAVSRAPRHLVVDLAALTFCCARGFALLAETALAATTQDVAFVLSGLTAHHHRVATMLLPDLGVIRFRSVADAVTAIRIDDTYRQPE